MVKYDILKQAVVGGEYGFGLRHFTELAVETFDSVSGINQPRNLPASNNPVYTYVPDVFSHRSIKYCT